MLDGVIVTDIRMPGRDGFYLLDHAQALDPDLPVILLTGEGDVPMAVKGMGAGAFDFLEKPCAPQDLLAVVEKALKTRALVLENRRLQPPDRNRRCRGADAGRRLAAGGRIARSGAGGGEKRRRGAGDRRARHRHRQGGRGDPPALGRGDAQLSQIPRRLADPRSARARPSIRPRAARCSSTRWRRCSPAAQFALLAALESQPGARVIAGTYRDLAAEATAGRFNPDLYWRLDLLRVRIPSLRERPEDIPLLFRHYVAIACEQAALPEPEITPEVVARLMAQDWPGNARSLMNAAMRFAMGLSEAPAPQPGLGLAEQMAQVERSLLVAALQRAGGQASAAARELRLPRKTFYDKLARHGIRAEAYRD